METNDDFNRIMEMNTESERRKFADMAMQGTIVNGELVDPDEVTDMALIYADELIAKLNKKKDGNNYLLLIPSEPRSERVRIR